MDEICKSLISMRIEEKHTPNYLPCDVVENILARLPVKSLLRLKAVCKQWSAIISDPIFIHTHLQHSKNSFCSFLHSSKHALKRVALENHRLQELSPLKYPQILKTQLGYRMGVWCFCDGLFLVSFYNNRADFGLWNPSRRAYKELHYPYPLPYNCRPRTGICYNQVEKDYKVLIVAGEHYAVFSCKNNSWSEMRLSEIRLTTDAESQQISSVFHSVGVHYNESVYWIRYPGIKYVRQIFCFDGRDEKMKIVCNLDCAHHFDNLLITSRNGLYLMGYTNSTPVEMVIKKILPDRMEHKVQLPFPSMEPLCFTQQNKIIFMQIFGGRNCRLYDCSGRCFAEKIKLCFNFSRNGTAFCLFPYIENLFHL